jgi:hypothetical protein
MSPTENPMRSAFFQHLKAAFYEELKDLPVLSEWDTGALYDLAENIVNQKKDAITKYLDSNDITLGTVNMAIQEVIKDILLREVYNMRI